MRFLQELEEALKGDARFVSQDGRLLKPVIRDAAHRLDSALLETLLSSPQLGTHFFKEVGGYTVFDLEKFMWVVNSKEFLPDSYTSFRNKIGLSAADGTLVSSLNDVSLVWPYKDCVLEGGQDKEDEKRDEVFYNETLASDEVARLLAPKAFVNAVRYDSGSSSSVTELNEDDNLIIKGNNLLVLGSLVERFEGKVKCIYIDPPYYFHASKEQDTFAYNSNFKKSTWLTFMENRLRIAKRLLAPDGAVFAQISDDGVAELHLLMKEIFGEENFLNKITVKTKSPSGFASVNAGVFETAEYILAFGKDKRRWTFNTQYVETGWDSNYKFVIINKDDPFEDWVISNIYDILAEQHGFDTVAAMRKKMGKAVVAEMAAEYALAHADAVFRYTAISNKAGSEIVKVRGVSKENPDRIYAVEREGQYTVYVHNGQEIAFYSKKVRNINGVDAPSMAVTNIWTDTPYEGIAAEGGVKLKGGKKPEKLLQRIIALNTNEGDLVLDYHLGSGTTAAVAHKMGRRYIGVEQLDYGPQGAVKRLKGVIDGEQTGISKAVEWQGGGSFVYFELAQQGEQLMDALESAKDSQAVQQVLDQATNDGLLRPSVLPESLQGAQNEFTGLSLAQQKSVVAELIDKNRLYVNASEIDDVTYELDESDVLFTKNFYEGR
ncbi:TPA: site-specific DNA-methyltransferase [Corynebacterium aurimucosum]|nr:site-specific DNA-methyltransferase [Corynebacterium aurimucosum]